MPAIKHQERKLLTEIVGKPAASALIARFGNLEELADASLIELHEVPGIGLSKALAIRAAFQLASLATPKTFTVCGEVTKISKDRVTVRFDNDGTYEPREVLIADINDQIGKLVVGSWITATTVFTQRNPDRGLSNAQVKERMARIRLNAAENVKKVRQ